MLGIGCLIYFLTTQKESWTFVSIIGFLLDLFIAYCVINELHFDKDEIISKIFAFIAIELVVAICIITGFYIIAAICIIAMGIFGAGCMND